MFLGYNTNGFAHHRLEDAIEIMADIGYGGVALTLDVHHLNPYGADSADRLLRTHALLEKYSLRSVIETGSRYLLNKREKHQPTLLSPDAMSVSVRRDFLREAIHIAASLQSAAVSFWSGVPSDSAPQEELMRRLVQQCQYLSDYAAEYSVRLAFEPEPGMFIDTMDKFAELHARVNHSAFGLTVDVGHLVCNRELPVSKFLAEWKHVLWNVHIEDMRAGVHDHLMFGEGEVDFADVFEGLRAANYTGGVYVELSRHSYDAVNTARRAMAFLERYLS